MVKTDQVVSKSRSSLEALVRGSGSRGLGMKRHVYKRSEDFLEMENPQTNQRCYFERSLRTVYYFTESSKRSHVLLSPQFYRRLLSLR